MCGFEVVVVVKDASSRSGWVDLDMTRYNAIFYGERASAGRSLSSRDVFV